MNELVERVTAVDYLEGMGASSVEAVRKRRDECQQVEAVLSFVRRLVQGRIDIVNSDLERRRSGSPERDLTELISDLHGILADPVQPAGSSDRNPTSRPMPAVSLGEDNAAVAAALTELDHIASINTLSSIPDLNDDEAGRLLDQLGAFERRVSDQRHAVHTRIDLLQVEIARRYQQGEANVDSLLS